MVNPLEFLSLLKDSDRYIQIIYTRGGCYQLYKILKLIYPSAIAYKVKYEKYDVGYDHIITRIEDRYYDINGEVDISKFYNIAPVQSKDLNEIEKWSFSKNYWLNKTCPNCKELIPVEY